MSCSIDRAGEINDNGLAQPVMSDELRRELWLSRVPGRSTEEKIRYLLGLYNISGDTTNFMHDAIVSLSEPEVTSPLPENQLSMIIDVLCLDCAAEGYTNVALCEDGWYFPSSPACPECDGERVVAKDLKIKIKAGL